MAVMSGGRALDAKLAELAAKASQKATVRVGFLEGARYPDGTPVAMVAAIQNFGAPSRGIPPRPFFTNMIEKHKGEWGDQLAGRLEARGGNAPLALFDMGAVIEGELAQSIVDTNSPALSSKTIKRKGFAKPLVDTGHMLGSISSEVTS